MSENIQSASSAERADLASTQVSRKSLAGWVLSVWIALMMVFYFKQFAGYIATVMDWLMHRLVGG